MLVFDLAKALFFWILFAIEKCSVQVFMRSVQVSMFCMFLEGKVNEWS